MLLVWLLLVCMQRGWHPRLLAILLCLLAGCLCSCSLAYLSQLAMNHLLACLLAVVPAVLPAGCTCASRTCWLMSS
jgi:hypothetical protein